MWAWVSITKAPLKPFNQMTDKRLLLRVAVKIMSLIGLLFVAGIFVAGLLPEQQPVKTAVIDVSSVEVGAVAARIPILWRMRRTRYTVASCSWMRQRRY